MTEKMLTAEDLAELEHELTKWSGEIPISCKLHSRLLAMASRLLELESALEFLAGDSELFDLWREDDEFHAETPYGLHGVTAGSPGVAVLHHCQRRGWTPPSQAKAGE